MTFRAADQQNLQIAEVKPTTLPFCPVCDGTARYVGRTARGCWQCCRCGQVFEMIDARKKREVDR
jgi:ribosomal protein L37AE/L43A